MNDLPIESRLASIERRLAEIEQAIGLARATAIEPLSVPTPEPTPAASVMHRTAVPPPLPPIERRTTLPPRLNQVPPASTPALEQTIGLKWSGWVGAVVLTIGAALGVKFAYDQHWFELLPPGARLAMMSLASLVLLAAGEVVYRRVNRVSAASLFGTGVALMFVVAYAGHGYYDLYGRDTAFVLMGLSTLLGCAVAVRGGMVSIATLSLIGGNLAPLILRSQQPRLVPFLAYLLMLQVVALALSAWGRGGAWRVLRGFSLATTATWIAGLLAWRGGAGAGGPFGAAFGFMLVSAALFHAEAIFGSRRSNDQEHAYEAARTTGGFTVLVTALLTGGLLIHLGDESVRARTFFILALAALTGAIAWALSRTRQLSQDVNPALAPLETAYLLQSAGLLVAAAPVALSGVWLTIAWAAMAVTFAGAGAALDLKRCRRAAVVIWTLAGIQLLLWTAGFLRTGGGVPASATWATIMGHAIPAWAFAAGALAMTGHVIGALIVLLRREASEPAGAPTLADAASAPLDYARPSLAANRLTITLTGEQHDLARFADAASAIVWLWAALAALPPLGATLAVAAYGICLLATGRAVPQPRLTSLAVAALVLAGAKWMIVDTTAARLSGHWSPSQALTFVNTQAAVGVLVATAMIFATRLLPRAAKQMTPALFTAAALCLFWTGTTEIDRAFERGAYYGTSMLRDPLRAKQFAISVYWALSAAACIVTGFKLGSTQVRLAGLGLLGVTLLKLFVVDMAQVQTGYRVLSFVALGLLLLATSVLYGRLAPRLAGKA